jgi:hypothetical protein
VIVVVALALAACGGDDGEQADDGVVDRTREVPADVRAFLADVVEPDEVAFTADYELLNKNGGDQHTVHVESTPPTVTVTIDGEPVDLADEPALARYGIFSGFLAANPKAAIEAAAQRVDAGDAVFSTRDGLECIDVPVQGATTSTWCLATIGIFGYVDTPAVRYELTGPTT